MKIRALVSLLLIISVAASFVGCKSDGLGRNALRVEYCELGIILTKDFETYDSGGVYNASYSDGKTIVGIARYSFVDCEEYGLLTTFTPLKLANVYLEMMDRTVDEAVQKQGDVPYFTYTETTEDGSQYFYMPTFYRTPYAYFVITFITPKMREAEGRVEFLNYIKTVYFIDV